jgi:hypothetical protein
MAHVAGYTSSQRQHWYHILDVTLQEHIMACSNSALCSGHAGLGVRLHVHQTFNHDLTVLKSIFIVHNVVGADGAS